MYFKNSLLYIIGAFALIMADYKFFDSMVAVKVADTSTLEQRIQPVGQVYLEGDIDVNAVAAAPVAAAKSARSGEQVYTASCASCHAVGVLGAPKMGSASDWAPRLKQGLDSLVKVAISGKGAMPPKGTCMDCSDDELKAAIEHMSK